ncbi:MAG: PPOX class F420-dependent oxidoreductase [Nitrososphaeraceae archaeon]
MEMSMDEMNNFLRHGTFTGKVATVRADGRPHIAPVWFVLDDDSKDLVFTTGHTSLKAKNILRDPRMSISVDDQTPLYSFVIVDGIAEISEQPDELLRWATKIAERYMGRNDAEVYGKRNSGKGELLIRVKPTKIFGQKNIARYAQLPCS